MKAKMYNISFWDNCTDERYLLHKYKKILKKSGFTVKKFSEYNFKNYGYTCVFILAKSHLVIHTFPEHNKSYIELSSCVKEYYQKFIGIIDE